MYLKRLVLIAGILFIVSSGELRAMEGEGEDSRQEEAVRSQGSGSPRSTGSVASTASDSSARFREIIAPLTAAVETLSVQIVSLLGARHHHTSKDVGFGVERHDETGCESFDASTAYGRGASGAGASNAEPAVSQPGLYSGLGQSLLGSHLTSGSRWPVSSFAGTAASVEVAFNTEELNLMTGLAVLNSKLDQVVALVSKTKRKPIKFGGVQGHPFGGLKPEAKILVAKDVVDDGLSGTVSYRRTPVVVGGVKDHPFGSIRSADACNGSSGTISRVPSVSPIIFGAVKSN